MAFVKLKFLLFLSLISFLLFAVPSQCYTEQQEEEVSAEEALFDCFVSCTHRRQPNERELSECEQTCVKEYQERKRSEERAERRGGDDGDGSGWFPQIEDPKQAYDRCRSRCERRTGSGQQRSECRRACQRRFDEQQKQQQEREEGRTYDDNHHEPVIRYKECQIKCGKQREGEQRQYCQQKCQWEYEREQREHSEERGGNPTRERGEEDDDDEEQQGRTETENPYLFKSQRFSSKYKTEEGNIRVLERFNKRSELLRGIKNYRLAILEANPNTFVIPHHCDADSVFVVVGGKGTISYVWQNQRQTFKVKRGDVMRVPAGSLVYLVNSDDNERLYVLKLLQPVNNPGHFKDYFGAGGENPESFYRTFSTEMLEAAFNIPKERLERIFGTQRSGVIVRASKEQIRALSKESQSSSKKRKGEKESWNPFNLLEERPLFSSGHGQFFEAAPDDYKQLQDLDVSVAFMNINKGGMIAPYYNSKSTKLVFVVRGSGYFEMACPHLAAQSQQGFQGRKERFGETTTGVRYQRISAHLSVGDTFVLPAGHPVAIVASHDSDLQLAGFGIKASQNQKYFLAGRENVWNHVQSEAKELSFQVPAKEVDEIFRGREESYFLPGPGQREEGRERTVASILDFVGF